MQEISILRISKFLYDIEVSFEFHIIGFEGSIGVDDLGVAGDCFGVVFFDLAEMFDFSDFVSSFDWSLFIEFGMLLTD